jgi:hypothetical protein
MTRTAIVLATLLIMMFAGFAEDAPKTDCANADINAAERMDCVQTPRARVRRSTSSPDKPGRSFFGEGYDARVIVPTYPMYEPYRAR